MSSLQSTAKQGPEAGLAFRAIRYALYLAGLIMVAAGTAKITSTLSGQQVFDQIDPLLGVSFKFIFLAAGAIEMAIGACIFFSKNAALKICLLGGLTTAIGLYRFGLWLIDYKKPCTCLGTFAEKLRLDPQSADLLMLVILIYMLIISLVALYIEQTRRVETPR